MSLLATDLRKRKKVILTKKITLPEAPPEKEVITVKAPKDAFDLNNETGQKVIEYIDKITQDYEKLNLALMLNMPTVRAYEAEVSLAEAILDQEKGTAPKGALKASIKSYIETHTVNGEIETDWTGKDIPLFYLTLLFNGEILESYVCNYIQVCIIREFWLRTFPESEFRTTRL